MTVERIRHIGIVVSNLARSEKAFKDLFGAKTITPIINNRGKTIKMLADETDLYSVEDGIKWLNQIFQIKENNWFSLFDFLPRIFKSSKKKKSAIVSLLLASLNEASTGKLLLNQESHFDKIMVKGRK